MSLTDASVAVSVLLLVVTSCGSPPAPAAPSPNRAAPTALVARRVENATPQPETLVREPMVVEHPSGVLFLAGYGKNALPASLWRSADGGATWTRVQLGRDAAGMLGNSDVDLAVARDGTLYLASMTFSTDTNEGTQVAVGTSHDVGATWSWALVSRHRYDDRPWVDVAPDGTAHVIWNDGDGVNHAVSRDGGATWQTLVRVHDAGGSSHLAIGPRGEIAVRVAPPSASGNKIAPGVDLIAVSTDDGQTWTKRPVPGVRTWSVDDDSPALPRWVEPIAWDAAGSLYSLSGDDGGLYLSRSTDYGARWRTWRVAGGRSFYPYLIAGAAGDLAASWYGGVGDAVAWNVARITLNDASEPRTLLAPPQQTDCFRRTLKRDTCGEYQGLTLLRDGGVGAVTTIQDFRNQRFGFTWWRLEAR